MIPVRRLISSSEEAYFGTFNQYSEEEEAIKMGSSSWDGNSTMPANPSKDFWK